MEHREDNFQPVIDPSRYGVSFSLKQCRNFGLDPNQCLQWLLDAGWRRFRLMSYWNEHEVEQGQYDFSRLDEQVRQITKAGGVISLCLGVKQPRWPEYHWPKWALGLSKLERQTALLRYVETVMERYKGESSIISWQLENEALLQGFGSDIDIDRSRLRSEYQLVKQLDTSRPVAMSTSNGWGIPLRRPRPDMVGFSFYPVMHKNGAYHHTIQKPWLHRVRKLLIPQPVFVHELQCEPWGPTAIWKMSRDVQDESMSPTQISSNISEAKQIRAYPIDFWGAEWWYWRLHTHHDPSIWDAVRNLLSD
jgi:hypothetical protein